jgi:hypothetical protein
MSQTSPEAASLTNCQVIFESALKDYKEKTGNDLASDPLLDRIKNCASPNDILDILRAQILVPGQPQSRGDKLLTSLNPTIHVLHAFSETTGEGVSPVGLMMTHLGPAA